MNFTQEEIDAADEYIRSRFHESANISVDGDIIRFDIATFNTEGWIIKHELSYSAKYMDSERKNHNGRYIRASSGELFDTSLSNLLYHIKSEYFSNREEKLLQSFTE